MSFMSYEWMIENEELMMFVIVPILMIPVGWVVTKILKIYENQLRLLLTNADNYGIMINITKGNKMKTKELKEQLWQAYYTAKDEGASRKVTNAILDVMVIADKEAEEKRLEKVSQTP